MSIHHITDDNFKKEVLEEKELAVLVDFWAPWCGPCKMIGPVLEELAHEYVKKIKTGKINVDECPQTATHYGIMSIPTIMFFKNGQVADQVVGAISKAELKRKIEENI